MLSDEVRYKLLKLLKEQPELTQREVASELGISLGKVNYCLKALADKGWIKATNFTNSKNKVAYMYLLTPRGIRGKARVTVRFLHRKVQEYETLRGEIDRLTHEVGAQTARRQTEDSAAGR